MTAESINTAGGNVWPYSPRNGVQAVRESDEFFSKETIEFSESEQQLLEAYAQMLYTTRPSENNSESEKPTISHSLEDLEKISPLTYVHTFYKGYFETETGKADRTLIGVPDSTDVFSYIADSINEDHRPDKALLRKVEMRSTAWHKTQLIEQLTQSPDSDVDFQDLKSFTVNSNPDVLLRKTEGLKKLKALYAEQYREVQSLPLSNVTKAQTMLIDLHIAKVNNILALLYPAACNLAVQLDSSQLSMTTDNWRQRLDDAMPVTKYLVSSRQDAEYANASRKRFMRRLDLVRRGAARVPGQGEFSPVSPELQNFIEQAAERTPPVASVESAVIERMKNTTWNAEQLQEFLEVVLETLQLKSADSATWEDVADRPPANIDDLWQVVISPKVDSLSVDGKKHVMLIPENFKRGLIQESPSGALPVAAHELTHVLQTQYDALLAKRIPLARMHGRRALTLREMGGMYEETAVFDAVGIKRPLNISYLKGIQQMTHGRNQAEVVRAVADSRYWPIGSDIDAKSAVNQALRLYRYGGFNSQPLDYLEQNLIMSSLENRSQNEIRTLGMVATAFALGDSATLRKYNLLTPDTSQIHNIANTVIAVYLREFDRAG